MSVASIVSGKDGEVATVAAEQTIAEAVELLNARRIGAVVVVTGEGDVAGILSERDIVRGLSSVGGDILTQTVATLMTSDVESCTPDDTVDTLMRKMTEGRFRHMPVIDGGRLTGVVSIGDVVKNRIKALEHEAEALRDYVMS